MMFVRFKCQECGEEFRALRLLVTSDTTRRCPKCGAEGVPPIPEDARILKLEEKDNCSSFG